MMDNSEKARVIFWLVIIGLLLWCVHAQADEPAIMASPQRDGTVVITKHDFLLLQQFLQAQNKLITKHQAESDYWQDRYATTEECVREALKAGKLVMKCFNDLEI
jgi:hypothetical protein